VIAVIFCKQMQNPKSEDDAVEYTNPVVIAHKVLTDKTNTIQVQILL